MIVSFLCLLFLTGTMVTGTRQVAKSYINEKDASEHHAVGCRLIA